jgi:hypothetical protein
LLFAANPSAVYPDSSWFDFAVSLACLLASFCIAAEMTLIRCSWSEREITSS